MKALIGLITFLFLISNSPALAQGYLTPLDFGLHKADHGRIDYRHTPPNILCGNFNNDCYPDVARFIGNRLEIYYFAGQGYSAIPQGVKTYNLPIKLLALSGNRWLTLKDLVVTLQDGTTDTIRDRGGYLNIQENSGFLPQETKKDIPRFISSFDFQLVWQSGMYPWGMNHCTAGDLDNDGINEFVTYWKETEIADSAWMLIYKCIGDNQYELYMQEPFFSLWPGMYPGLSQLMIADLDQNGQNELIFTYDRVYLWEFSAPGVYTAWHSNFQLPFSVEDMTVCDVNHNGVQELALLASNSDEYPPTCYMVKEHYGKQPPDLWEFTTIAGLWQDWQDDRFAVGDFDNDGAADMVAGNSGYVIGYDPVDIQYYRYDPTQPQNFAMQWLHTGLPLSCANPEIADFDSDGRNELFAGGLYPHGGSAFIWKPSGIGTGTVAWLDTSTMVFGPNKSALGNIDGNNAVMSQVIYSWPEETYLYLFSTWNHRFSCQWQSQPIETTACEDPVFIDMDHDGKMNVVMAAIGWGDYPNSVMDWEQTSSGIPINPPPPAPAGFALHPLFPNPFNSTLTITIDVAHYTPIDLEVYNIQGQIVFRPARKQYAPGTYHIPWHSEGFPSGLYFVRVSTEGSAQVEKAVLLK